MSTTPLPRSTAWRAVARSIVTSAAMFGRREIRQPTDRVGREVAFDEGVTARIYRETATGREPVEPCVLVVEFRLRWVRGRGHALFRAESLLNTPLFVGFPGFVSKLWLAHDDHGVYRGIYEWDGPAEADAYARSLWHVLALVSQPGSIDHRVLPGRRRDEILAELAPATD